MAHTPSTMGSVPIPAEKRKVTVTEAMARLPGPQGERSATLMEHGSMLVKVYAPRGTDPQQPHAQDEVYVIVQGSGDFVNGESRQPFRPGDLLFVPVGVLHRFENFTEDLIMWVVFYGPAGGELPVAYNQGESQTLPAALVVSG